MKNEDIAYIAGLFDGEGCVANVPYRASKNGQKYNRVVLRITNTHKPVLDWVNSTVGFGCVKSEGIRNSGRKECYRYIVSNAKAVALLRELKPFLKIKADTADAVLSGATSGRAC